LVRELVRPIWEPCDIAIRRTSHTSPMDDLAGALCHYTTADAAFEHIIPSGQLRMSPYARMRDPLENRELTFAFGTSGDDTDDGALMDMVTAAVRQLRSRTLLLSFSIDAKQGYTDDDLPFMRGWARARMWEQYASNHAGVCIAFDREPALNHMTAHLKAISSMVDRGRVVYSPRGFRDTAAATVSLDHFREDFEENVASFVFSRARDLFRTKALDWQSEHEYRVTILTDQTADDGYLHVPFGDASSVRALMLGERFPDWQLPAARWACERFGVELLRLQWQVGVPRPLPAV
jgi:hypothetical protein